MAITAMGLTTPVTPRYRSVLGFGFGGGYYGGGHYGGGHYGGGYYGGGYHGGGGRH